MKKGEKVTLAILLRNNGQRVDWEGIGNNLHPMGILDARLGEQGNAVWKIQGVRGGIHPADTTRGIYNNGGLYGERAGWYLPGFPDATWKHATTMHANTAGVTWYRTHFTLKYPTNQDAMLRLNVLSKRFSPDRKTMPTPSCSLTDGTWEPGWATWARKNPSPFRQASSTPLGRMRSLLR